MALVLALDAGTTGVRALAINESSEVVGLAYREFTQHFPEPGWVEHDLDEIWDRIVDVLAELIPTLSEPVAAIGITNQRETVVVWDRVSGKAVYNAIVWQDRRTADLCATLRKDSLDGIVQEKTGLLLDPYFSATKIRWILDYVDGAHEKAKNGELCFGTVDSYVLWHLTGGQVHATDVTNASRTMLYNIHSMKWDDELLESFGVYDCMMPEVRESVSDFGQIDIGRFGRGLTVGGIAGDQQSAMIGQGCIESGMIKSTYGTGCFALIHTGDKAVVSGNRLLTTIACSIEGVVTYALEGSIFNAGTAVQFLRDNFEFFENAKDSAPMALSLPDNGGVFFVPAFTGLGAPYWNPEAKALIYGLSRDTKKEHIVRAALEAQAYQTRDLMGAMEKDSGQKMSVLRADGGLVANEFMCQFLSDILQVAVEVPRVSESTAWGAACLAGVQAGVFENLEDATSRWQCARRYEPKQDPAAVDKIYAEWKVVVEKTF